VRTFGNEQQRHYSENRCNDIDESDGPPAERRAQDEVDADADDEDERRGGRERPAQVRLRDLGDVGEAGRLQEAAGDAPEGLRHVQHRHRLREVEQQRAQHEDHVHEDHRGPASVRRGDGPRNHAAHGHADPVAAP